MNADGRQARRRADKERRADRDPQQPKVDDVLGVIPARQVRCRSSRQTKLEPVFGRLGRVITELDGTGLQIAETRLLFPAMGKPNQMGFARHRREPRS